MFTKIPALNNLLVRVLGWLATVLHGDPSIFDRWLWLRKHLLPGAIRTLEAGSGSGAFTLYAAKIGNTATGISFDERNNRVARERARILGLRNVNFLTADLRRIDALSEELGSFDQIICCETMEHIVDDQKLISDLAGLLHPGGRLLVTSPSVAHRPFHGERLSDGNDGGHVRFGYDHADLHRLFESAGLETISLGYLTGALTQAIIRVNARLAVTSATLAWLCTVPLRLLQPLDPWASRFIHYPQYCVAGIAIRRRQGPKRSITREAPQSSNV